MKLSQLLNENEFDNAIEKKQDEISKIKKKISELETEQKNIAGEIAINRNKSTGTDYNESSLSLSLKDNKDSISKLKNEINKINKKISEYKYLKNSPLHKETSIQESPVLVDIDKNTMLEKIKRFLIKNKIEIDDFEKTNLKDIYLYNEISKSFYIHYTEKDGITAFMEFSQNAIKHKNRIYKIIVQGDTYNIKKKFKNFTLKIFKEVCKRYNRPIMIDDKNSKDMKNVFLKWLENPKKYGIKDYFVFDSKNDKTLLSADELEYNVWEEFERAKRYTIVFDFNNNLSESDVTYDIQETEERVRKILEKKV